MEREAGAERASADDHRVGCADHPSILTTAYCMCGLNIRMRAIVVTPTVHLTARRGQAVGIPALKGAKGSQSWRNHGGAGGSDRFRGDDSANTAGRQRFRDDAR